jgi:hypothetical protein
MVKITDQLDYTPHELEAKRLLKEVHQLLLLNDFVAAVDGLDRAMVELRLMRTAIKSHIKE